MIRQAASDHLLALAERLFRLPECAGLEIRQMTIRREEFRETTDRKRMIEAAMDACWHDGYSDIDMKVLATGGPNHPLDWLEPVGVDEAHCLGFLVVPESRTCRIVFREGFRYDITVAVPDAAPVQDTQTLEPSLWPRAAVNRFWFVLVQALGKLYRQDYLIARHLAHMQLNETLVQQMVLRDIRLGTRHHRYGGREEAVYQRYVGMCPFRTGDTAFDEIAGLLYCAARAYDELLKAFYPVETARTPDFEKIWLQYEQYRRGELDLEP